MEKVTFTYFQFICSYYICSNEMDLCGGIFMSQLSEKELSTIKDLLSEEELLVKKFQMLAEQTQDTEIKQKYERISNQHQGHLNALYAHLQ